MTFNSESTVYIKRIIHKSLLQNNLTLDRNVLAVAVLLTTPPVLHLTHIVALVLQMHAGKAQLQHPVVSGGMEGEFPAQSLSILVQALAVLWWHGLWV